MTTSVQCDTAGRRSVLKPTFARLGRRGGCPYVKTRRKGTDNSVPSPLVCGFAYLMWMVLPSGSRLPLMRTFLPSYCFSAS